MAVGELAKLFGSDPDTAGCYEAVCGAHRLRCSVTSGSIDVEVWFGETRLALIMQSVLRFKVSLGPDTTELRVLTNRVDDAAGVVIVRLRPRLEVECYEAYAADVPDLTGPEELVSDERR